MTATIDLQALIASVECTHINTYVYCYPFSTKNNMMLVLVLVLEPVHNWFQPGASKELVCFFYSQERSRATHSQARLMSLLYISVKNDHMTVCVLQPAGCRFNSSSLPLLCEVQSVSPPM